MASLLVLSGVTKALDLWRAPSTQRPNHLAADLTGLLQPPLQVVRPARLSRSSSPPPRSNARDWWWTLPRIRWPPSSCWAHAIWAAGMEPDNSIEVAARLDDQISQGCPGTTGGPSGQTQATLVVRDRDGHGRQGATDGDRRAQGVNSAMAGRSVMSARTVRCPPGTSPEASTADRMDPAVSARTALAPPCSRP